MENAICGKRNFNDVTSLLHGRLPEYPIAQRFLEIGFEISACANSVYQAFLPLLNRLGTRLILCVSVFLQSRLIVMEHLLYYSVLHDSSMFNVASFLDSYHSNQCYKWSGNETMQ